MAFTAIQTATQVAGTGSSAAIAMSSTTAGNLLIAHILVYSTNTATDVTDNQGNTWVLGSVLAFGNQRMYQAYCLNPVAGVTAITVDFSASTEYRCGADEYSGGPFAFDVVGSRAFVEATNLGLSTPITPQNNGLIVVTLGFKPSVGSGGTTWTAPTDYSNYGGGSTSLQGGYRLLGTTSETAPWTCGGGASSREGEIVQAFKLAAVTKSWGVINGA